MTYADLCDRVVAATQGITVNRADVDLVATAVLKTLGLEINARTGEIYNPAMPDGATDLIPRQQNVRYAGMPTRESRRKLRR